MQVNIINREARFVEFVQPTTTAITLLCILIGYTSLLFQRTSIFILFSSMAVIALTIRNWFYFSTLDYMDLESINPLKRTLPWLLWTMAMSSVTIVIVSNVITALSPFRLLLTVSANLLVVLTSVIVPRYLRVREEPRFQDKHRINEKDRYELLRRQHYLILGMDEPNWDEDESYRNVSIEQKLIIKQLEAIAIYNFEEFSNRKVSLLGISVIVTSIIPAMVLSIIAEVSANFIWAVISN